MKQLLPTITFLLILSLASVGQENNICPTIKVISPEGLVKPGEPINFSTAIMGKFENRRLEYKWTVSTGTISEEQGSPAIMVVTTENMAGQTVTATVEIKGLSEGCKNSAFGTGEIDRPPPLPTRCPIDTYGKLPWLDVKVRIQNGPLVELANDQKAKVFFVFSITRDSERKSILIMQKKILKFLKQNKFSSSRILMRIVKDHDYQTTVWIVPEGAKLPNL